MNPSARIKASLEIYERLEKSPVPMDSTIGDYLRFKKYIGAKDRSAIVDRVYSVMRHMARLRWHLDQIGAAITPVTLILAHLILVEKYPHLIDLFDGSKYGPDHLSEDELKTADELSKRELLSAEMPDTVQVECPPQYEASLRAYFGEGFASEMSAFMEGATLDLRVNHVMASVEKVQGLLAKDGVEATTLTYSPWGLRVAGKTFLSRTKAFVKGFIDIQDEGSQLIALACDVKPGMQVLDYCAGAGGKTLALANAMSVKGRIVAMDLEEARLQKGRERFRRARVSDIIEVRPLSDEKHRKWLRRQDQSFDVVLTDVPCSGTGTWRRNPDMRWRQYGPSLEVLLATQAEIMDRVVHVIKKGGKLVYATCSILPEENEQQVENFLARHPDFRLMPPDQAWPEGCKLPCDGDVMRLTPKRHNTDGFFAAVLQKIED